MKLSAALTILVLPLAAEAGSLRRLQDSSTIDAIKTSDKLRCGTQNSIGFASLNEDGTSDGLEVDLCRAIAATILGDSEKYEIVKITAVDRFVDLAADKYDVLIRSTTHTLVRDTNEPSTGVGFTFSVPYFYDGMKFAGPKGLCADSLDWESSDCADLKVCVSQPTTHWPASQALFPEEVLVPLEGSEFFGKHLEDGDCNAIASEGTGVFLADAVDTGYTANGLLKDITTENIDVNKAAGVSWEIGANTYTKEPLAMVTREDDPAFSDTVNWVLQALITAEEQGITGETAVLTDDNPYSNAVASVGNFGEIYERNLGSLLPRGGLNNLNMEAAPQLYSFPGITIETSE